VEDGEGRLHRLGWRALGAAGRVVGPRVARGAAAVLLRVKQRVLDRAGVHGGQVRALLDRLGYERTGQVLPVANELYRPRVTIR
jgi:hypothetical protein